MAEETTGIDALQWENRRFPPSESFKRDTLVAGPFMYDEAAQDYQGFWAGQALDLVTWAERVDVDLRVGAAVRQVVRRRQAERHRTTASTGTSNAGRGDTCGRSTGRANRVTPARSPTPNCSEETAKFANVLLGLGVQHG